MFGCIDTITTDARYKLHRMGVLSPNETIRFLADNCAVIERFAGNCCKYRAVNLYTLAEKSLPSTSTPLSPECWDETASRLIHSTVNAIPEGTIRLSQDERAAWLVEQIFNEVLPANGFFLRECQRELSLSMLRAMQRRQVELSEAEVGTGKTHAYIIAAVVHGLFSGSGFSGSGTTILSTSTVALQSAVTEDYLPKISTLLHKARILDKPLTWKLRKGKGRYVCDRRLYDYLFPMENWQEIGFHNAAQLATLSDRKCSHIDLDSYQLDPQIKARINVKHPCEDCPVKDCRYSKMNREILAGGYDFLITNHNYVLADVLTGNSLLPEHDAVIFDEAHKLPDTARDMYGDQFCQTDIPNLVRYISPGQVRSHKKNLLFESTNLLLKESRAFFDRLAEAVPKENRDEQKRYEAVLSPANRIRLLNMMDHLRELPEVCAVQHDSGLLRKDRAIRRICGDLEKKLAQFVSRKERICWLELQEEGWRLCSVPKELHNLLYRDLWRQDMTYILTSGTLSAPGMDGADGFTHIRRSLGMELLAPSRLSEIRTPSPFDYKRHCLLYLPKMPYPKAAGSVSDSYVTALADEIVRLVHVSHGHALILFTSYQLLKQVFALAESRLKEYPLYCMGRGRLDAIERFRESKNGVLFASDTCGEGLDIAGDTLSLLVIVRLPFPVPDPITDYEKSQYDTLREYLNASAVPDMLIKLKQYAGRLIRSETDTGVIAILDSRAGLHGRYHPVVCKSLFDTEVTDRLYHVRLFYARSKPQAYFE